MIDKSQEGREILNNLFIQTKMMGAQLDIKTVRGLLTFTEDTVKQESKNAQVAYAAYVADCTTDAKALTAVLREHQAGELTLKRHLEATRRNIQRRGVFKKRAQEEHDNYKSFEGYIKENEAAWKDFYANAIKNFADVKAFIEKVGESLRALGLKANEVTGTAFVELPESYELSLAELSTEFENFDSEIEIKPILSNLLEIMADKDAVKNREVIRTLKNLFHTLIELLRERQESLENENEHNVNLFSSLVKSFHDNVTRGDNTLAHIDSSIKDLDTKVVKLGVRASKAEELTEKAGTILKLRLEECHGFKQYEHFNTVRAAKMVSIIGELNNIVRDSFSGLSSYFIQRGIKSHKVGN